jgi:hypothetical protein
MNLPNKRDLAIATLLAVVAATAFRYRREASLPAAFLSAARDRPETSIPIRQGPARAAKNRPDGRSRAANESLAVLREMFAQGASLAAISEMLDRMAETDPRSVAAAGEVAGEAGYGDMKGLLLAAAEALIKAGHNDVALQAVSSWAKGPLRGDLDNATFEVVSTQLAQASLPDAVDWLTALPPSEARNYALGTLATSWADADPRAAMDLATSLTPEDGRDDAMQRVFNRWSNQDVMAATQWLSANAADPAADRLIAELIGDSTLLQANPRLAATWAESISDSGLRQRYVATVIQSWGRRDPSAAAQYLAADSILPAAQKQQFLQALGSQ